MTVCAIMAALMCVLGPISIPIGPIPVSLTIFVIYLSVMLIGMKFTLVSYGIYILLGIFGLPVFSGYAGGVAKIAGPTGGYLLGFIFMIIIGGLVREKKKDKPVIIGIGMVIGLIVDYVFGTAWFVIEMQAGIGYALSVCVWPFIPFDIIKIVLAIVIGKAVGKALGKAGLEVQ